MATKGLLVRLEAKPGKEGAVEDFLRFALRTVQDEPATLAWFALKFSPSGYGVFNAFPDEAGRTAHLGGAMVAALRTGAHEFLARPPEIEPVDLLAHKLPVSLPSGRAAKGVLLRLKAGREHAGRMEKFLRGAENFVAAEPKTLAWFALRFDADRYGIFDVLPARSGGAGQLTGHMPRELIKHAVVLLDGAPDLNSCQVLAEKIEVPVGA
jgi:quinol monooxygenase YgiN